MAKKNFVFGIIGSVLDAVGGFQEKRWEKWRPTVSLFLQEDLYFDESLLFYNRYSSGLMKTIASDIASLNGQTKVHQKALEFRDAWDFEEVYSKLHDFFINYEFDTKKYDYYVHISTGTHVAQIILFLLTETNYIPAKLIQTSPTRKKNGSRRQGEYTIIDLDLSKYDKLAQRFKQEHSNHHEFLKKGIQTKNKNFNQLIQTVEKVALRTNAPILLTGPTGAGKSQLAKQIFSLKKRKAQVVGEYVEVNCSTLRGDSALSTLFGHKKGAFTGAVENRDGLLLQANQGVIFLDEIGELGLDEQAMLLSAVEEKKFYPVGADVPVFSDFQLFAGTNRDLKIRCEEGLFREDLLARINTWTFELPGLAQRREDIEPNLIYETQQYEKANHQMVRFSKEGLAAYLQFACSEEATWRANFRDLNASVLRMCTLSTGGRVDEKTVKDEILRLKDSWQSNKSPANSDEFEYCHLALKESIEGYDLFDLYALEGVLKQAQSCKNMADLGRQIYGASRQKRKNLNDSDRIKKYLQQFQLDWNLICSLKR